MHCPVSMMSIYFVFRLSHVYAPWKRVSLGMPWLTVQSESTTSQPDTGESR